jgi:hypothetical protein
MLTQALRPTSMTRKLSSVQNGRMPPATARRRRLVAAIGLGGVIVAGLSVHLTLPDTAGTHITGDALYAVAAYLAVVLIAPHLPALVAGALALAWCVGVELFQLTGIPSMLDASFPPTMLLLGTVFDVRDLVVYSVTIVALTAADAWHRSRITATPPPAG